MPPQPPQQNRPIPKLPEEPEQPSKASDISNTEWGLVIGAIATTDVAQIFLDAFGIGALVNRFIDIAVALSFLLYLWLRDVEMDMFVIVTLAGAFAGEEIPMVDAAPFWTLDAIAIMRHDRAKRPV